MDPCGRRRTRPPVDRGEPVFLQTLQFQSHFVSQRAVYSTRLTAALVMISTLRRRLTSKQPPPAERAEQRAQRQPSS